MSIFDKWNEQIDTEKLAQEVKEVEKNSGEYKEVPLGQYEVKIEKMELKESKSGAPMVSVQFRILEGEFKKSCLFMNQIVTKPFQIGIVNAFLRSLETDVTIEFDGNYAHYNNLILDVFEVIDKEGLEFLLNYRERNGFKTFNVKEVYAG